MPVRMRLQRHGRTKRPFYHIVVADARAPRDGRFIERLGIYNPTTVPAIIEIDREKALDWLGKGAEPTKTVRAILRFTGVLYKKHLLRGVKKGALTEEQAEAKFNQWLEEKTAKIDQRKAAVAEGLSTAEANQIAAEKEARLARRPKAEDAAPVVEAPAAEEAAPKAEEAAAPVAEEPKAEEAAPVVEEAKTEESSGIVETVTAAAAGGSIIEEVDASSSLVEEITASSDMEVVEMDDLTKIEGIGPKTLEMFASKGIISFKALSEKSVDDLKAMLEEAGYAHMVPDTWAKQAEMAAEGKWDELKKWQDELDGGKA